MLILKCDIIKQIRWMTLHQYHTMDIEEIIICFRPCNMSQQILYFNDKKLYFIPFVSFSSESGDE